MATENAALDGSSGAAVTGSVLTASLRRAQCISGIRAMTPFLISAFPLGLIGGAFGMTSGLGALNTLALAMIVNSGTVQFVGIRLIQEGASAAVILLTALVLSLRLVIYSTMLRSHTRELSQRWRVLLGFGLIDAVFFVVIERFKKAEVGWQWFFFGASAAMYVNWIVATVIGIVIGGQLPDLIQHGLDFPMTAVFAAMLASSLVNWKVWLIVLSAGICALIANPLPYNTGLIVATGVGTLVGGLCDWAEKRFATRREES